MKFFVFIISLYVCMYVGLFVGSGAHTINPAMNRNLKLLTEKSVGSVVT